MKSWLKGGIIGVIVLFLPLLILNIYIIQAGVWEIVGEPSFLIRLYLLLNKLPVAIFPNVSQTFKLITAFFIYFIIGAIVGLIISKIKFKTRKKIVRK